MSDLANKLKSIASEYSVGFKVDKEEVINRGNHYSRINGYKTGIEDLHLVISNDLSTIAVDYPSDEGRVLHSLNECTKEDMEFLARDYLANYGEETITCHLGSQNKEKSVEVILTMLKQGSKIREVVMGTYQTPDRKIRLMAVDNTLHYASSTGIKYSNAEELTKKFLAWGIPTVFHDNCLMYIDREDYLADPSKLTMEDVEVDKTAISKFNKFFTKKHGKRDGIILVVYNSVEKVFEVVVDRHGLTKRELCGLGASIARAYGIVDKDHVMHVAYQHMKEFDKKMEELEDTVNVEHVAVAVDAEESKPHMNNFATIELPPEDLPIFVNFTDLDVTIIGHSVEAYRDGMSYKEIDGVILDFEDPNWAFGVINKLLSEGIRKIYYVKGNKVLRYNVEEHINSMEDYTRSSSRSQRRSYGFDDDNRRRRWGRE